MVYKVDGNPQIDSLDWSMYSKILKSTKFYLFTSTGSNVMKDQTDVLQSFEDLMHHQKNECE